VRQQHGVVTRQQLLALGYSTKAIRHRLADGRLHPVHRNTYAVGRPELSRCGQWMAAVLACGPRALLSHASASALWGIRRDRAGPIEVSVLTRGPRPVAGIRIHRRHTLTDGDLTEHRGIPVTSPVCTLIDLAAEIGPDVEAAVNEADRLNLVDPETVRAALDETAPRPGVGVLRELLDRQTFNFTRSELERRFRRLARDAGLPEPQTCAVVNGFEVDFYWPELPLIVETDGLRYHRTPTQQKRDRLRDQAHTAAGIPHLRFTHAQVRDEPAYVRVTLAKSCRVGHR
jgi:very-short-patch-repair endonuclease